MRRAVRQSGSVTVYFCLSLAVSGALILALTEAVHWEGLNADAQEWTNLASEALFAGYQPYLLQEYDMFYLDGSFGGEDFDIEAAEEWMESLLYDNVQCSKGGDGWNAYRMWVSDAEVTKYILATDGDGEVFKSYAAKTMKSVMGKQAAQEILNRILDIRKKQEDGGNPEQSLADGESTLINLRERQAAEEADTECRGSGDVKRLQKSYGEVLNGATDPYEDIKPVRQQGILALVLPDGKTVSSKTRDVSRGLLNRALEKGNGTASNESGRYDRILMQEFIKPKCGSFLAPDEDGVLSYGVEYLICGKGSDKENLEGTVKKLMLLREAVNYLYLQTDEGKKAEALATATLLAGASANPLAVEAVKQGILAAWAYAESICDTKALLSGGKVSLLKNAANWKTQLSNLKGAASENADGDAEGLSYENYLDVFLYAKTDKTAAYRCMDLMEWNMQKESSYVNCRMDHMLLSIKIRAEYRADTIFCGIFSEDMINGYHFVQQAEYEYR